MAYGVYSDRGYREHILERNKNTNKTEVFTQEDQTFTGRKTFLSGVTTSDLEVQTVEVSENLKVKGKDITEIIDYLPNDVSKENKLTTEDFVNSSIATNTAYFRGTFDSVEDLEAYEGEKTDNDYAFVRTADEFGAISFNRYKYNSQSESWEYEYTLNNSSFTSAQWEAINSGITAELVAKIGDGSAIVPNFPIGAPMAWLSEVPPVGFLAFDGSEYNQEDFPELYEVIKNIPSFHSDTAGKFKIPNLKGRVLQGADTVIGELIEAGLPNIKGKLAYNKLADAIVEEEGALFNGEGSNNYTTGGGISGQQYAICLDASKGETKTDGTLKTQDEPHVYGNSDTVQMDAFTVYWVIKATNYVSLEKNAIDDTKTTNANAWSAAKTKAEIETVDNKFNFSTDEIIVGKFENKNVYKKTVLVDTSTLLNYVVLENVEHIFSSSGEIFNPNENSWFCFPWANSSSICTWIKRANNSIQLFSNGGTFTKANITFIYTKTTN